MANKSASSRLPFGLDPFLVALIACVAAASAVPCRGAGAVIFGWITSAAITLLFFLHGAKLSREAIWEGAGHWRLHLVVLASTFLLFPSLGFAIRSIGYRWLDPTMAAGLMFLCLLPSTVQSSIGFTAIARGNVPAAVCSATLSNLTGIVVTPVLVSLFLGGIADHAKVGSDLHSIGAIAAQLLLPFALGHAARPLFSGFLDRHKTFAGRVDRLSILLVVYTAFSAAVVDGLWRRLTPDAIAEMLVIDAVILATVLLTTSAAARLFRFSREDEIAVVFCGSKKSLASGVPMAGLLFPSAVAGPVIVPLMLFHQMQLMVCAVIARRYSNLSDAVASQHSNTPAVQP